MHTGHCTCRDAASKQDLGPYQMRIATLVLYPYTNNRDSSQLMKVAVVHEALTTDPVLPPDTYYAVPRAVTCPSSMS